MVSCISFSRLLPDDEGGLDLLDLVLGLGELFKLGLVGEELGLVRSLGELLDGLADGLLSQPLELVELRQELVDLVLGALDRAGQQQDHLHYLLVLGYHLVQVLLVRVPVV